MEREEVKNIVVELAENDKFKRVNNYHINSFSISNNRVVYYYVNEYNQSWLVGFGCLPKTSRFDGKLNFNIDYDI